MNRDPKVSREAIHTSDRWVASHAKKAWAQAVRRTGDPAVVLLGAHQYAADPNLPEMQFIPHPATWLRGERWADGPLAPRVLPQPARTTRALVGLARHANTLPMLPAAGA